MAVVKESDFHPDFGRLPQSKGMPAYLPALAALLAILLFGIGTSVVMLSGSGHMWPSDQSMRKPLGKLNLPAN